MLRLRVSKGEWLAYAMALVLAVGPPSIETHLVAKGPCPPITAKQDFNVSKYMGTWYGQASFGTESTQGKGRCVTARYTYNRTADHVDIYNWQVPSPGYRDSIRGYSVLSNPLKQEGIMNVTFQVSENKKNAFQLIVVDTDYFNWAVVYYCKDLLEHHEASGWILTRAVDLDLYDQKLAIAEEVGQVLRQANLSHTWYSKTDQRFCSKRMR